MKPKQIKEIINIEEIPEKYQSVKDPVQALKYWIKELYYYHLREDEIMLMLESKIQSVSRQKLYQLYLETKEELEMRRKDNKKARILESDKEKFEEFIATGLRLSLDKGDPKAYFSGLEILGRLYGLNANKLEIVNKEGLSTNLLNKMRQVPKLDNGDK